MADIKDTLATVFRTLAAGTDDSACQTDLNNAAARIKSLHISAKPSDIQAAVNLIIYLFQKYPALITAKNLQEAEVAAQHIKNSPQIKPSR